MAYNRSALTACRSPLNCIFVQKAFKDADKVFNKLKKIAERLINLIYFQFLILISSFQLTLHYILIERSGHQHRKTLFEKLMVKVP